MDIDFNVADHRYSGKQSLTYTNHSPDTLTRVFYHLFYNAFQPGSAMYTMHRNVADPDHRLLQIALLPPEDQGYLKVSSLQQDGTTVKYHEDGTILEVDLVKPLLPGESTRLDMEFNGQVPVLVRRAGRNNSEGISYSMAQWYPKLCAYDADGWHPNPYLGYEFYGDFGDFDVKIMIDRKYILGATGILKNADVIGCGYEQEGSAISQPGTDRLTWHFVAKNVHDFAWAADPEYTHQRFRRADGIEVHYLFQKNEFTADAWAKLPAIMDFVFDFLNTYYGRYPYPVYSFIQAGDGGMEYPMATLITGHRSLEGLVGVAVHELIHSWYHGVIATNELRAAWMDEGFTNYLTAITMRAIREKGLLPPVESLRSFENDYKNYIQLTKLGLEEPLSTHANHFKTTTAYYASAYSKGCVFLAQLEYVLGEELMQQIMLRYFNTWKFRHPSPLDFIRVAEKESGFVLDWYYEYWVLSTKTIDYAISSVEEMDGATHVTIARKGQIPMPLELNIRTKRGQVLHYYIPLNLMRGNKRQTPGEEWVILEDWVATSPQYEFTLPVRQAQVVEIQIDPSGKMADVQRANNIYAPDATTD